MRGAYLFDAEGHAYADFLSGGFGVFAARRSHPVIKQALADALEMDFAAGPSSTAPGSRAVAERLLGKAPGLERVFLCNSGTEAVESALKFARHATARAASSTLGTASTG